MSTFALAPVVVTVHCILEMAEASTSTLRVAEISTCAARSCLTPTVEMEPTPQAGGVAVGSAVSPTVQVPGITPSKYGSTADTKVVPTLRLRPFSRSATEPSGQET